MAAERTVRVDDEVHKELHKIRDALRVGGRSYNKPSINEVLRLILELDGDVPKEQRQLKVVK